MCTEFFLIHKCLHTTYYHLAHCPRARALYERSIQKKRNLSDPRPYLFNGKIETFVLPEMEDIKALSNEEFIHAARDSSLQRLSIMETALTRQNPALNLSLSLLGQDTIHEFTCVSKRLPKILEIRSMSDKYAAPSIDREMIRVDSLCDTCSLNAEHLGIRELSHHHEENTDADHSFKPMEGVEGFVEARGHTFIDLTNEKSNMSSAHKQRVSSRLTAPRRLICPNTDDFDEKRAMTNQHTEKTETKQRMYSVSPDSEIEEWDREEFMKSINIGGSSQQALAPEGNNDPFSENFEERSPQILPLHQGPFHAQNYSYASDDVKGQIHLCDVSARQPLSTADNDPLSHPFNGQKNVATSPDSGESAPEAKEYSPDRVLGQVGLLNPAINEVQSLGETPPPSTPVRQMLSTEIDERMSDHDMALSDISSDEFNSGFVRQSSQLNDPFETSEKIPAKLDYLPDPEILESPPKSRFRDPRNPFRRTSLTFPTRPMLSKDKQYLPNLDSALPTVYASTSNPSTYTARKVPTPGTAWPSIPVGIQDILDYGPLTAKSIAMALQEERVFQVRMAIVKSFSDDGGEEKNMDVTGMVSAATGKQHDKAHAGTKVSEQSRIDVSDGEGDFVIVENDSHQQQQQHDSAMKGSCDGDFDLDSDETLLYEATILSEEALEVEMMLEALEAGEHEDEDDDDNDEDEEGDGDGEINEGEDEEGDELEGWTPGPDEMLLDEAVVPAEEVKEDADEDEDEVEMVVVREP